MARSISKHAIRSLANLYSPSVFRTIINNNDLSSVEKRISKYKGELIDPNENVKFEKLIKAVYSVMTTSYKNEYIFKNSILNKLLLGKYSLKTTTLFNEFKIGKSIADVVLVNGEAKLFEIKTNLDNLKRLNSQLFDYQKAIGKIYIVTDTSHVDDIIGRYFESNFGLIELTCRKTLKIHKEAVLDTTYYDYNVLFKMLRKNEYLSIVAEQFGNVPDVPNTLIYRECLKKILTLDVTLFHKLVFDKLKSRKISQPDLLLHENTPLELRYLCYINNLTKKQYHNLYNLLRTGL